MRDRLFVYLCEQVFCAGWYGEVTVKVENGVPTRVIKNQNMMVKDLA